MRKGIVGGTFDTLHDGHLALLNSAFENAGYVIVGITSDRMANESRERTVDRYESRASVVDDRCKSLSNIYSTEYDIMKIEGPYDGSMKEGIDFIVLSPEGKTHERASEINRRREEKGLSRLQVIEAPMIRDFDGRKISATRIHKGEIDEHGERL